MSMAALLEACRNQLRENMPVQDAVCDVQEDGQPPPGIGQLYISVHPLGWFPTTSRELIHAIDETYSVGVTVTKRTSGTPRDRRASSIYLDRLWGFEGLTRKVMTILHQSYPLMAEANQIIREHHKTDQTIEGFVETLRWQRTDESPTPRDGTWLWADPSSEAEVTGLASESLTIVFSEARRIQRDTLEE
jgi:hypothetical protein